MQEISLADTVRVETIPSGILLSCDRVGIPTDEKNLCHKAARLYLEKASLSGGVRIDLKKRIPDGAGMGGGSSDAAAVLKAMSCLYPAKVDLPALALAIGADVPFFLLGKSAFCEGIGEKLTPLSFPAKCRLFGVAAKNAPGLQTAEVYKLYDAAPTKGAAPKKADLIDALQGGRTEKFFSLMRNDLELAAFLLRPEIALLKEQILSLGASCAMMTGSGSAVFGLFSNRETALSCAEKLREYPNTEAHFFTLL